MRSPLLALANIHRVQTEVAGRTLDLFVFDHHRSAFTLWCLAAQRHGPLTLVTLDRHMDLNPPASAPPPFSAALEVLDTYVRDGLAPENDQQILAAMEAGAIGEAAVVARSHAPRALEALQPFRDAAGRQHPCVLTRTLEEAPPSLLAMVERAPAVALDIDLDCFTTLSDGHLGEVLDWDRALIEAFLRPPGSERFWSALLGRCAVVTLAREPYHCGGLGRGAQLWNAFADVFFGAILRAPAP